MNYVGYITVSEKNNEKLLNFEKRKLEKSWKTNYMIKITCELRKCYQRTQTKLCKKEYEIKFQRKKNSQVKIKAHALHMEMCET